MPRQAAELFRHAEVGVEALRSAMECRWPAAACGMAPPAPRRPLAIPPRSPPRPRCPSLPSPARPLATPFPQHRDGARPGKVRGHAWPEGPLARAGVPGLRPRAVEGRPAPPPPPPDHAAHGRPWRVHLGLPAMPPQAPRSRRGRRRWRRHSPRSRRDSSTRRRPSTSAESHSARRAPPAPLCFPRRRTPPDRDPSHRDTVLAQEIEKLHRNLEDEARRTAAARRARESRMSKRPSNRGGAPSRGGGGGGLKRASQGVSSRNIFGDACGATRSTSAPQPAGLGHPVGLKGIGRQASGLGALAAFSKR